MIDYNDLIGKKFQDRGRGPNGYDCYGLLVEVYRRNGIVLPTVNVSVCACQEIPQKEIDRQIKKWVRLDKPEHPCAILIKAHLGYAQHIAAYIGRKKMIHVTTDRNVVVDLVSDYQKKIIGFYQYVNHDHNN